MQLRFQDDAYILNNELTMTHIVINICHIRVCLIRATVEHLFMVYCTNYIQCFGEREITVSMNVPYKHRAGKDMPPFANDELNQ